VIDCPECGGEMRRVREVIDAWFDSGSMPFAQYHYPFGDRKTFDEQYPADFISEGIDQSRGWFYSLLAISTFVTGGRFVQDVRRARARARQERSEDVEDPGERCETLDVLDSEEPMRSGGTSFFSSPPWVPTRFDRKGVVDASQKLLGTVRNVYSFFAMYAEIDGYRPGLAGGEANLLDRWILSRFHSTVAEVRRQLEAYRHDPRGPRAPEFRPRRAEQLVRSPFAAPFLEGRDGARQDRSLQHAPRRARRDAPASRSLRSVRRRGDPPGDRPPR